MNSSVNVYFNAATIRYPVLVMVILLVHLTIPAKASLLKAGNKSEHVQYNDTAVKAIIKEVVSKRTGQVFHYPKSLERFYHREKFMPVWTAVGTNVRRTWEAMLLLDCVLQFGLSHTDYHPNEVLYSMMHDILETPAKVTPLQKAKFDMLLTDALVTFINNLHFGKLNPLYSAAKLDNGDTKGFCADEILSDAMRQGDFMTAVLSVQPKTREYVQMQEYMRLIKGQYVDDCYETPEGVVRKLAINMERLRWYNTDKEEGISINIPSFTLKLYQADSIYQFKVVVGKPATPTHVLQSTVNFFNTAPDWKVPKNIFIKEFLPRIIKDPAYLERNHLAIYDLKGRYVLPLKENLLLVRQNPGNYFARQSSGCDNALGRVVFRFPNAYGIYLHDTPDQHFFARKDRALSHGCIRVAEAEKLAALLLQNDGQKQKKEILHHAMTFYEPKTFTLNKPVPIKVNYLTCEIIDGLIVDYDDIYNQDKALERVFYKIKKSPVPAQVELKKD